MVSLSQYSNVDSMSFGKRLKEVRTSKKISQEELSSRIGIHANHLSRYERDLTQPSIEVVKKIAKALEISIDALVFGEANNEGNLSDNELISLFKNIENFSNEDKTIVKTLIDAFITKRKIQKLAE